MSSLVVETHAHPYRPKARLRREGRALRRIWSSGPRHVGGAADFVALDDPVAVRVRIRWGAVRPVATDRIAHQRPLLVAPKNENSRQACGKKTIPVSPRAGVNSECHIRALDEMSRRVQLDSAITDRCGMHDDESA